ncbi:hypothetical protein ACJX0J_037666, partial [Zea mays]
AMLDIINIIVYIYFDGILTQFMRDVGQQRQQYPALASRLLKLIFCCHNRLAIIQV